MTSRLTRKRGQPNTNAAALHAGAVRRGTNGAWWLKRNGVWAPIQRSTLKKRQKKASQRMISWAKQHGMIKVFYNNPESCNYLTTTRKTCMRIPAPLKGWHMSNKLRPTSSDHKYTHIDEYIGPIDTMKTMHTLMEAQFKTYKKLGLVTEYDFQVKTMMEKYHGWGRLG